MYITSPLCITCPYDQRAFSPLDPTAGWFLHMALAIYIFAVVNFDALAQASDFRIEKRQVVLLGWMQDSNLRSLRHQIASRLNAHSQIDWDMEDQAKNLNSTGRPNDEWAFKPTWLHCRLAFAPGCSGIHDIWWILMQWHRQVIFGSKGDKLPYSAGCRIRILEVWDPKSPQTWIPTHKPKQSKRDMCD